MKLQHNFTIPANVDTVWRALLDPARIAPCFPGATITSASGDEFAGTVKVRLGPIALQYKGAGRFTETDEAAHRAVIEASGTASGGQSTAAATVTTTLAEEGAGTVVTVLTTLSITGAPAQFGRGMMEDVGAKIIGQFADSLAGTLGAKDEEPPAEAIASAAVAEPSGPAAEPSGPGADLSGATVEPSSAAAKPSGAAAPVAAGRSAAPVELARPSADEIDLLEAAGGAVAKRVLPLVGGLVLVLLVIRWLSRR